MDEDSLRKKLEEAQTQLVAWATGSPHQDGEYKKLRAKLIDDSTLKPHLPDFIVSCRSFGQFWAKMKDVSGNYQGRREFIWNKFDSLFGLVEGTSSSPADQLVEEALSDLEVDHVRREWQKALNRKVNDPQGALTIARTLLESVFKSLLDEFDAEYSEDDKITNLYHKISTEMNLSPSQHTEHTFSTILGNIQSVVQELASVRSKHGDAHGDGQKHYRPDSRHAEFAVNLAGSVAMFLVRTWHEKYK